MFKIPDHKIETCRVRDLSQRYGVVPSKQFGCFGVLVWHSPERHVIVDTLAIAALIVRQNRSTYDLSCLMAAYVTQPRRVPSTSASAIGVVTTPDEWFVRVIHYIYSEFDLPDELTEEQERFIEAVTLAEIESFEADQPFPRMTWPL